MPDNPGQATQWATTIASLILGVGGLLTAWWTRRTSMDTTRETSRQFNITTLIDTMQEEMGRMRQELKDVRRENDECYADRNQMRNEIRRLKYQVAELQGKVE